MVIHRIVVDASGIHRLGLQTEDAALAERWAQEAPETAVQSGHMTEPVVVHFEPLHGNDHGLDVVRSVHRIRADMVRTADGHEVRALYHYPDRDADDTSAPHPTHPLISKRQWAKIPQNISRRHHVIKPKAQP